MSYTVVVQWGMKPAKVSFFHGYFGLVAKTK